ncbi:hypothetical protein HMPREF1640_05030 [Prevotella sp. S7-1-8]|nr:hypothetical protein HMPREF1640_05030 [Prevotella sp. S7-1-8]
MQFLYYLICKIAQSNFPIIEVHDRLQLGNDFGSELGHEYPFLYVINGEYVWMLLGVGCEDGVDSIEAHEFLFAEPWA